MAFPVIYATATYLRRDSETLFLDYRGTTHPIHAELCAPPGGKVKEGESAEKGAAREVYEEVTIVPRSLIYRGTVLFSNEKRTLKGKLMRANWEVAFFDCSDFDATRAHATEGSLVWVPNELVLSLPLHAGDRIIWKDWLLHHRTFRGTLIHEGEALTSATLTSATSW